MDAWENNPLRKELANGNDSGSGRSSVQLTSADASQTLDNAAAKVSQLSKATAELQIAVQNQLPDGWFKHMDESTGRPFFVHTETGVTQWNLPVAEDEAAQQVRQGRAEVGAAPLTRKPTFMPEGWSSSITDAGQKYYVHQASQNTQWERPPGN